MQKGKAALELPDGLYLVVMDKEKSNLFNSKMELSRIKRGLVREKPLKVVSFKGFLI